MELNVTVISDSIETSKPMKKAFKCSVCQKILSCKETLRNHILSRHLKIRPFICDICKKKFILKRSLLLHKNIHNTEEKVKDCECGKKFKNLNRYRYHIKRYHPLSSVTVKCTICHTICIDKRQLRYHVQQNHIPKTLPCSVSSCKRVFPNKSLLRHHLKTHYKERFRCPVCLKKFKSKYYMKQHMNQHEGILPYKCTSCEKRYANLSHVNFHWKRVHSTVFNFLCSFCGRRFKNKYDVIIHEKSHEDKKFTGFIEKRDAYGAEKLRYVLKSKNEDSIHTLHLRPEAQRVKKNIPHYEVVSSESLPFKCLDCEKCFKTRVRANEHWRRYHFVRTEFKCSFCRFSFQSEKELGGHNCCYEGKYLKCKLCSFQTQYKIALHSHEKIHKSVKIVESNLDKIINEKEKNIHFAKEENQEMGGMFEVSSKLLCNVKSKKKQQKLKAKSGHESQSKKNKIDDCSIGNLKGNSKDKKSKCVPSSSRMDEFTCPWENEYFELSEGFIIEPSLFPSLDVNNKIDDKEKLNNCVRQTRAPSAKFKYNESEFNYNAFRNPKLTLNCTAVDYNSEECELYSTLF